MFFFLQPLTQITARSHGGFRNAPSMFSRRNFLQILTYKVVEAFDWAANAQICVQTITWKIETPFYGLLWMKPNRNNVPECIATDDFI